MHRLGTTLVILVVALCASAAATVGPTYYSAAKHSILQDALSHAGVIGRGFQAVQQGPVQDSMSTLESQVTKELNAATRGAANADRLFAPSVESIETKVFFPRRAQNTLLVARTDVCHHLRFARGNCPGATGQVAVSSSLAQLNRWTIGQSIRPAGRGPMTVTGIYVPPATDNDYWFSRGTSYFPAENPTAQVAPFDALFTPAETIAAFSGDPQGTDVVSRALVSAHAQPADADLLQRVAERLSNSPLFTRNRITVTTGLAGTTDTVKSSWHALSVPVFVVTAELLVLTWLLLFLVVTDAVDARGTEIALAKLRGYGAGRALRFGLSEPTVLLMVALPLGALLGWALTGVLAQVLLRDGTPVGLPGLGWFGAAVASVGGIAAIAVAARRTITRPVVEEWRRTGRKTTDRGWVFDAVVLTAAVAGLIQLFVSGTLTSARHSALALLVPGLLGLAVAVVASRLLPLACRATFGRTRRGGGLGPFLAVRHLARRPGGTRTTMILATAVALATFSLASWSVGATNRQRVAALTVGAPTVLTVAPKVGTDLGAVVDRIDPGGKRAAAVVNFTSNGTSFAAVQPKRFAAVANWRAGFVPDAAALLSKLHPPAPDPVTLQGDQIRMRVDIGALSPVRDRLILNVVAQGATAPTPVDLGVLPEAHRTVRLQASLPCQICTVRDLEVDPPGSRPAQVRATLTVSDIEMHTPAGWRPVPNAASSGEWTDLQDQRVGIQVQDDGVRWSFVAVAGVPAMLSVHDHPEPLPAVVSSALAGDSATVEATGLNGAGVTVAVAGRAPNVPGAPANGVVTDLTYAERTAAGNIAPATAQVWVRGPVDEVRRGLHSAGIPILSSQSSAGLEDEFRRQGPGFASVLFLADALAAAVLAALAAVLSVSVAARRRRYEYAALAATGAPSQSLYAALAIEQLVVVGFAMMTGVASGLLSVGLAAHSVPGFVSEPADALLRYRPDALFLGLTLGAGFLIVLASGALAAAALMRTVSPEQLREAPS